MSHLSARLSQILALPTGGNLPISVDGTREPIPNALPERQTGMSAPRKSGTDIAVWANGTEMVNRPSTLGNRTMRGREEREID